MKKADVVKLLLGERADLPPRHCVGKAYAPSNIALCKYWGKRNVELNLPVTSSLSISLASHGASVQLSADDGAEDIICLNGKPLAPTEKFSLRLIDFLQLFRPAQSPRLRIDIETNIPIAAGLASSACGFASLVKALDALYGWELSLNELSILARIGSGSASRSLWHGFVEWHQGDRDDGMDSQAEWLPFEWPELRIGLCILSEQEKNIGSREAMQRTVLTSSLYSAWPSKVSQDMALLKQAIKDRDFTLLGCTAESNALTMHATMLGAWPPVYYALPETVRLMQQIWRCRNEGLPLYFTQDAGPNLKLLFLSRDQAAIEKQFPHIKVIAPFDAC